MPQRRRSSIEAGHPRRRRAVRAQDFTEQGPHEHDPDDSEEGVADQANWIAVSVSVAEHHGGRQGDQEGGK